MVRPKRFELLAYRFVACCSIQLSYERVKRNIEKSLSLVKENFSFFLTNRQEIRTASSPSRSRTSTSTCCARSVSTVSPA